MREAVPDFLSCLVALCGHERESWPMRLPGETAAHRTCLACGRRRPYTLLEPGQTQQSSSKFQVSSSKFQPWPRTAQT